MLIRCYTTPMSEVRRIVIIFNPASTGKSQLTAERFAARVHRRLGLPVELMSTERQGHGKLLARRAAQRDRHTMIISSSGDGGYHEIINGILKSRNPDAVTGLLPAGNANDHYSFMHHGDVIRRIGAGRAEHIDALCIQSSAGWKQYAHSYAGVGLTSQINDVLKQHEYHPLREFRLAFLKALTIKSVRVTVAGKTKRLDNLLFLNAGRMSKMIKTSGRASISDGKFEIIEIKAGAVIDLARYFFRAITVGVNDAKQAKTYVFTCEHDMGLQMDGERKQLHTGETITITIVPRAIHCII